MMALIQKLYTENNLSKNELLKILRSPDEKSKEQLFRYAHETRIAVHGTRVYMRGLIEFSNYCVQNCRYCGIRRGNKGIERYRLDGEEILDCCRMGYQLGYRTFVLQSGEDPWYTDEAICDLVQRIKREFNDCAVTLSLGERSYDSYRKFYDAGADRYLLRHETASGALYEELHEGLKLKDRIGSLHKLKEIGFQVGAGFMVGLPGQTDEDLVEDLIFLKQFKPEMVGIGPFIPHPVTPLGGEPGGTVERTLLMIGLTRLLLPDALMPATTAMGTLDPKGREKALKAGANVVMPNLSPVKVREKYQLYKDKICTGDEAAHCRKCIEGRIKSAGFEVDMGRGDHVNWRRNQQ